MIGPTIGVTAFFGLLVLILRPSIAMGFVVMSMMVWPEFLRIPVGLAAMSAPRIVAIILILRLLFMGRHKMVNLFWVDKLVIISWVWIILATLLLDSDASHVYQMIGRFFDTVLMYFIARFTFTSSEDVKGFVVPLSITVLFMAYVGVQESITAKSIYQFFDSYRIGEYELSDDDKFRYGFMRAMASTSVSIYFGMAMMVLAGFSWSVRGYARNGFIARIIFFAGVVGTLSSMSSGPWLGVIILIFFNLFEMRPGFIKPSLGFVLFLSLLVELASNRHFYNLIDYVALNPATAWYRTRLLEVAFDNLNEFWLVGVGSDMPHHWGAQLDGRVFIDVVNHFLMIGLYGGLPAMFMYIATHVGALKRASRAWRGSTDPKRRHLLFGLCTTLLALDFSSMSVGLFGPVLLLSYILLGMLVSTAVAWEDTAEDAEESERKTIDPYELEQSESFGRE